jgi:hypothetical protein
MNLREAINQWQALPPEEKVRRRWALIPMKVAMSMEFDGEPVDLKKLEEAHASRLMPPALSAPPSDHSASRS